MPLNVTIYDDLRLQQGTMPNAASLTASTAAQVIALGAASTVITGPAMLCLIADEGQRIAIGKAAGYVAPAATGVKLLANVERWQRVPAGNWYLYAVAG